MADAVSAEDYKQGQKDLYAANAPGWEKFAESLADQAEALNVPLIEATGVSEGDAVLDLACGAGEPAVTAARYVGQEGRVTATDLSPEMLAVARRRAEKGGFDNIEFEIADMEDLPFGDAMFDRVISRFGVMYSPNPITTFSEVRRVLKPDGRAGFAVWGEHSANTLLSTVLATANARLNQFTEEELEHPFCYGAEGSAEPIMRDGGLTDVEARVFDFRPKIKVGIPFWRPLLEMNFAATMAGLGDEERAAIDEAVRVAFAPYREDDVFKVTMQIRILLGSSPA